jgi:hypothetical protein
MPIRAVVTAALLMLTTAPVLAEEIGCEGVFNQNATLADFEAAFGKQNVVTGEVPGPEGTTMIATMVYPDDPQRSMQLRWWDEENVKYFAGLTLAKGDSGPGGVKLGMPIADVQAINGEPFTLLGFFWDYGGSSGFEAGKLADLPGGCFLNIHFYPTLDPLPEDISNAISGDMELRSDMPEVLAAKVVVDEINLGFPYPPELEGEMAGEGEGEGTIE